MSDKDNSEWVGWIIFAFISYIAYAHVLRLSDWPGSWMILLLSFGLTFFAGTELGRSRVNVPKVDEK